MLLRARPAGVLTIVTVATLIAVSACSSFEGEAGDIVLPCVDVDSNPAVDVDFAASIRPMINGVAPGVQGCEACHFPGQGTHNGVDTVHLDLTTLGALRKGGTTTNASIVIAGQPCESGLVQKLRGVYHVGARMPKNGPFWTGPQVQLVSDWIVEGAKGDDSQ